MDCRDFGENLQAYIDDELTEAERKALDNHLEGCESCSRQLRELWKLNDILHGAFSQKPSTGGLTSRVVAAISDKPDEQEPRKAAADAIDDDPSKDLAGKTLAGYKIMEKIGSGGMGTVYRAEQISMSRDVALKVLYHRYSQDEVFVKRFIREARSAGGLNHSNIVRVYDVGQENGFYFMSMEFVKGRSVHDILIDEGCMAPERALDVIVQTARALEHAQKRDIIHRDVKPENIIIDEEGHVKLADLGLAKNIGMAQEASMTVEGQVMGTPQYMSPEQVSDSSSVDHRTDLYSLGASLYYMVTGDRPFEGNTAVEIMVSVIHDEVRFKREHHE
jgi:serine/threonine protein kinase